MYRYAEVGVRTLKEGAFVPWIYYVTLETQPLSLPINVTIKAATIYHGRMNFSINDGAYNATLNYEVNSFNWNAPIKVTVRAPEDDIVEDSKPLETFVYHGYEATTAGVTAFLMSLMIPVKIESNDDPGVQVTVPANNAYTNAPPGYLPNIVTFDNTSSQIPYDLTIEEGFNVTTMGRVV